MESSVWADHEAVTIFAVEGLKRCRHYEGMAMGSRRLQTCFISAPIGVDTQPLREALAGRGVESWDTSVVLTGTSVPRSIEAAIADADFLCAVIPAGPVASNVYFEIGVAVGIDRPLLLFVEPKADLPVALREQPYARTDLSNASALRFHLDAFLKNAGKDADQREPGRREVRDSLNPAFLTFAIEQLATWEAQSAPPQEFELVLFLADVFEAAGYVTSTAPTPIRQGNVRPDMAVWIDELQTTIGNPLLVEVVAERRLTSKKVEQLQQMLTDFQSPLGLLVFWQADSSHVSEIWRYPTVMAIGARELVEAIGRGELARTLLARRNAVAHSAA